LRLHRMLVSEAGNRGRGGLRREAEGLFTSEARPTLVFAGGGHSLVVLAAGTRELTEGGFDVAVLAPTAKTADIFRESGLASGDDDACG
jgi:hypothetical protein